MKRTNMESTPLLDSKKKRPTRGYNIAEISDDDNVMLHAGYKGQKLPRAKTSTIADPYSMLSVCRPLDRLTPMVHPSVAL